MERKAQEKVAKMFDEKAQEYEDVLGTFEADFFESLEREAEAVGDEKPNNGRDGARGGAGGGAAGSPGDDDYYREIEQRIESNTASRKRGWSRSG